MGLLSSGMDFIANQYCDLLDPQSAFHSSTRRSALAIYRDLLALQIFESFTSKPPERLIGPKVVEQTTEDDLRTT